MAQPSARTNQDPSTHCPQSTKQDITREYVDPDRDAYIPEPHRRPWHGEEEQQHEEEEAPFHVHVQPHTPRLPVGEPVKAVIAVDFQV